jgi:hypothetical protein
LRVSNRPVTLRSWWQENNCALPTRATAHFRISPSACSHDAARSVLNEAFRSARLRQRRLAANAASRSTALDSRMFCGSRPQERIAAPSTNVRSQLRVCARHPSGCGNSSRTRFRTCSPRMDVHGDAWTHELFAKQSDLSPETEQDPGIALSSTQCENVESETERERLSRPMSAKWLANFASAAIRFAISGQDHAIGARRQRQQQDSLSTRMSPCSQLSGPWASL